MEFNEQATAAMAVDETEGGTTAVDETYGNSVADATGDSGATDTFFSTPAPELVAPPVRKHSGSVASVRTLLSKEKGTGGIEINLHSDSNGKDYSKTIWVLDAYRDNPQIDAETLRGIPAPEGKTQTPFERYGRIIQNKKGTGELQQLTAAGVAIGRTFNRYTTFEQLGEVLNASLAGTPVFFTSVPEESQTGFKIKVGNIYPHTHDFTKIRGEAADGN